MRERPLSATLRPTFVDGDLRTRPAPSSLADDATVDELAVAATTGDIEAVGRLYDALVGPIYRYVAVRVRRREDAEDLTHLVFERIFGALPRYKHNGRPFAAWAFRIARNAVIDHQRRLRPTEQLGSIAEPADGIGLEALSLHGEEIRELQAAIRQLTPDQQEAIALRYAVGLSAEEAARVMGRRAGTIRGLTFRAIEALRRRLTEDARR
ncbi:MAG TPA: sigma-70 family RNA polymerase sigma factor [Candidatus Limnocylindrales bacterium]|nr:sigma-70 family RNA polymerase sigma factor [Candidatus Limnocylindrales bacterium]